MSYILDALKKAERERSVAQVPNLMSIHDTQPEMPQKRPWIILGICLVCAAAIIWLAVTRIKPSGGPIASSIIDKTDDPIARQTDSVEGPGEPPPRVALPTEKPMPREKRVEPTLPQEIPATNSPGRKPTTESTPISPPKQTMEMPVPTPKSVVQPQTSTRSVAPPVADGTSSHEGTQSAPASLREALAKMTMTILMYSDIKSESMAFINDRKYVEGEYIDGRYLLESITPEGAILSYQGERALLRSRAK